MNQQNSWRYERDYSVRGQRSNAYVATNGSITKSASLEPYDIWESGLQLADLLPTQGTTLLALYNNDNVLPAIATPPFYGDVALNRPIIVDEIGIKLVKDSTCNFSNYQLCVNVLHLDQATIDLVANAWVGTCAGYAMANWQIGQLGGSEIIWRRQWSPDRLYNAGVGPPDQPGIIPVGRGPNAIVACADKDGEKITTSCNRPLVPLICDGTQDTGTFRPPKNSFILDPGQAIAVQLYSLIVPPPGFTDQGAAVMSVGAPAIAAWIRFRQPLPNEIPYVLSARTDVF